ncbi:uncharacterized protein LOC125787069 [Astyanax mexicanus]|uniref:uncharacterized protein LOC125787069 n=1 Tax=Astyanax mexicanus TaxID=7994 RepID=UPI0020CB1EDD|nr:uncharacterized protein LOC125787069 [Astyanax mexicanus]
MFSKPSETLAECNRTSCRSVKKGYQMIYNQYLQGNLSLIIPVADFRKRGYYICDCDDRDVCDVRLRIKTLNSTVYMKVGETLVMEVDVLEKVEVIYSSTDPAKPSSRQFCRVDRRSVEFESDYTQRASLTSDLELRELKESDSGVYTLQYMLTKEVIWIYTVIVHGDSEAGGQKQKPSPSPGHGAALPGWVFGVLVGLGVVCVVSVVVIWVQWRKIKHLQRKSANKRNPQNNSFPLTEVGNNNDADEEE